MTDQQQMLRSPTRKDTPKYVQIMESIQQDIRDGKYKSHDRLPTEQGLATQFGASRVTVRQALEELSNEEMITRIPGKGTFVRPHGQNGKPLIELRHIALVFVDVPETQEYNVGETASLSAWLSERDIALSVVAVRSQDLMRGTFPAILKQNNIQFILFDGVVRDCHVVIAEKANVPYLILGNHAVSHDLPQIRVAHRQLSFRATQFMHELTSQDIALLVEPFQIYYTRELSDGYRQAVAEIPGARNIVRVCFGDDGYDVSKQLLADRQSPCSLITTKRIVGSVLRAYQEEGISTKNRPIFVVDDTDALMEEDRRLVYQFKHASQLLAQTAAKVALDAVNDHWQDVYEEIVYAEIIAPVSK